MNYDEWIASLDDPQALLQNIQFVEADVAVEVDVKKFDKVWSLDKVYYIPLKSRISSQRKLRFVNLSLFDLILYNLR